MHTVKEKDMDRFNNMFTEVSDKIRPKINEKDIRLKKSIKKWDENAVAVLGPRGSFTDAACDMHDIAEKKIFGENISEVIHAVKHGKVKAGILPIENSIQGTVTETLDGINYNNLHILKKVVIPIHHCCASLSAKRDDIKKIFSHPHAIMQCSNFIEKEFPNAKTINTLSTSEAFKKIKKQQLADAAAIGPEMAAKIYGLKIISNNIEDEKNNETEFVVISDIANPNSEGNIISTMIRPFNEKQGILFKLMGIFDEGKINLTKIKSRPIKGELGKYLFYIDFEGNLEESRIKKALSRIKSEIGIIKVFGCFQTKVRR
jgi:chorismate mutase/prephenate dehydratase